jgi:YVTN family beta-propeller protein
MPNRIIILGIRFPVISTLCCILIMYCNNSEAQVSENTLESVANQPGVEGSPQIISGNNPLHIYGDYDIPTIYVVNSDSDTVTVIDTANNTAYRNLRVGISPVHIYGDPMPNDTSH